MSRPPGAALALAAALAGCGEPRPGAPGAEAIEVLVATPPATLDPRFSTDPVAMRLTRLVHAGLVRLDEATLAPRPYLAERWAWQGELALDVELRPGVTFASGAPFEAADVCATLEALGSERLASPHRGVVAAIARCEPRGPRSLQLKLREPRATLVTDLELPVLRRDQAASPPGAALDSLGPFALVEAGESAVSLRAREGGPTPRPQRDVVVRVVRDETARATRLLSGKADVVPNAISPAMYSALEQHGLKVDARPGANLTYLLAHNQRPPLDDARVRRALALALDRDLLASAMLGGRARVARSFLPPESWVFAGATGPRPALPFDPQRARAELASLGVRRLSLLCSTDRLRATMGRAVAQMLGDVGVEVELLPLDLGVMIHRLTSGDYELAILQIPELTEPNVLRWFFHSSTIPAPGRGGANRARYASPRVDAWLDEAARLTDTAARAERYRSILDQMADDLPVVPLFHEDQVAALSPRASWFHLSPEGRWLALAR